MVNKCAAPKCCSGYAGQDNKKIAKFHFPMKDTDLNQKWIRFVNRVDWTPTEHSVLCELHFDEYLLKRGGKTTLKWSLNPVPTIYSKELNKAPSSLPTKQTTRKPPTKRNFGEDQLDKFYERDIIKDLNDINETNIPPGFNFKKEGNNIILYRLVIDEDTHFPKILESIKIDRELHIQLQYNGMPIPLPKWFVEGQNAKLSRVSILENLPAHIRETASQNYNMLIEELRKRQCFQPKGRPPYSAEVIRFALHLRYTSLQSYKILLQKFPMPSVSLLNRIQKGGVDSMKALELLRKNGNISSDCILMVDEMYLQKSTQYQGGEYVGADEEGNLYKGIVALMIVGMSKNIPYIIQAIPEVTFSGKWLADKMSENIKNLNKIGFCVRGIVTDNHSANVNAFSSLVEMFSSLSEYYIEHPENFGKRTYLFYDTVHLHKNFRNNLLNGKKFVFPEFVYRSPDININCPAGFLSWADLHNIYDKDKELKGTLRKAPKLSYQALHPGNNKQNVPLALSIIHETTIAAAKSYVPNRKDIAHFLTIFNTWWTISNSSKRYTPNKLGNAIVKGDQKTDFYRKLADYIETWSKSPNFTLTKQTARAFINTLRAHAILIDELLNDNYEFILTTRLQSDPIERRFSQYRQMSGGRFLVSLREVMNSERILVCRSLLKENINFWEENLQLQPHQSSDIIDDIFYEKSGEIQECSLDQNSKEVATTISGYIAKKLEKRSKCESCKTSLKVNDDDLNNDSYLNILSRGGLFVPSNALAEFVCSQFAILDFVDSEIVRLSIPVRKSANYVLSRYGPSCDFVCENHIDWGFKFATKIVINIYFNNKQTLAADQERKDSIVGFKKRQRTK